MLKVYKWFGRVHVREIENKDIDSECHWNVALFFIRKSLRNSTNQPRIIFIWLSKSRPKTIARKYWILEKNEKFLAELPFQVATKSSMKDEEEEILCVFPYQAAWIFSSPNRIISTESKQLY